MSTSRKVPSGWRDVKPEKAPSRRYNVYGESREAVRVLVRVDKDEALTLYRGENGYTLSRSEGPQEQDIRRGIQREEVGEELLLKAAQERD
jgi:hypothetical protein